MSVELIALLTTLLAFSLYGVLSGVELAVAMIRVEPRLAPAVPAIRFFRPRLEATNVFLALGCLGLVAVSAEASAAVMSAMWPVVVLGLLSLVVRAGFLAYVCTKKVKSGGVFVNYVFALSSLIVPLALGALGIYMVSGHAFWQTGVGAVLFASLLVGLLGLSFGFIYYIGGRKAPEGVVWSSRVLNLMLAGLLAMVLLGVLNGGGSHLFGLAYAYLAVIGAGIVLLQAVLMVAGKEWRMWWCLALLSLLAPFLLGLANYPYLVFPAVRL